MRVFACILAATLLAGCARQPLVRTEIVEVPIRVLVPVPLEMTERCNIPALPSNKAVTYGDIITHLVEVYGTVEECNAKLQAIREYTLKESVAHYPRGCTFESFVKR